MQIMKKPELKHIDVNLCRALKRNPQYMSEKKFVALVESIRKDGFLSPILVRPEHGGKYEILAGNHRWLAAKEAGLKEVPAIIASVDDKTAMRFAINSNTIHGTPSVELLAPFLADMPDDILQSIHLDDITIKEICGFDDILKKRLDTFEIPPEIDRESPLSNILQCTCPKCGKKHIAVAQ